MNIQRTLLIGIDGAGSFARHARMPHLDALRARGAWTWNAHAERPTISAECWGSMLMGVTPDVHGLTNDIASQNRIPADFPHRTIFHALADAGATRAQLHSIIGWRPIRDGIIGPDAPVTHFLGDDEAITARVEEVAAAPDDFRFAFLQMDGTDGAGHQNGYGTPAFLAYLERIDGMIGRMVDALARAGRLDDTLVIVTADHGGGGANPKSHGSDMPNDVDILFVAVGPGVAVGEIANPPRIVEFPGMILSAMGVALPEGMREGRIVGR